MKYNANLIGLIAIVLAVLILLFPGYVAAEDNSIVEIARSQLGKGEIYGNNKGSAVKTYTKGQEVAWCAGFVSWVIAHSNRGKGKSYLLSARSYWRVYKGSRTQKPRPGDVVVFYRGGRGNQSGHVGIVEKVEGKKVTTIEGNVGKFPAVVKRMHYTLGHIKNLIGFVEVI